MSDSSNIPQTVESFDAKMLGSELCGLKNSIANAKIRAASAIKYSRKIEISEIDDDMQKILELMEQAQAIMNKPKVQEYTGSETEAPF